MGAEEKYFNDLKIEIRQSVLADLNQTLSDRHRWAVQALQTHFATVRKKQVPDLADRIETMNQQIETMVQKATLDLEHGRLVVRLSGPSEGTWKALLYGSDWFVPSPLLLETMLAGLMQ